MVSTAAKRLFSNRGKLDASRKKMTKTLKAKPGQYFGQVMKIGHTDKDGFLKVYAIVVLICDKNGDAKCQGEQSTVSINVQDAKPDAAYQYTEADQMARIWELWDRLGYDQQPDSPEAFEQDVADLNKERPLVKVAVTEAKNGNKYLNINGLASVEDIREVNDEVELAGQDEVIDEEVEEGGEEAGTEEGTDGGEGGEEGGETGGEATVHFEEPAPKPASPKAGAKPTGSASTKAPAKAEPAPAASRRRAPR